jgi:protein-tyrosine-phosphatase
VSLKILTLCTGNAARSVMLGYMMTTLAEATDEEWSVRTAGTHVAEGSAMSSRTRDALLQLPELAGHHYEAHRGHQLTRDDVDWCDVILASEAAHVVFVRSQYPESRLKTVSLGQFLRDAPLDDSFVDQVTIVALLEPDAAFDVEDPAGGDQAAYNACASQLWEMAQAFATLVETP